MSGVKNTLPHRGGGGGCLCTPLGSLSSQSNAHLAAKLAENSRVSWLGILLFVCQPRHSLARAFWKGGGGEKKTFSSLPLPSPLLSSTGLLSAWCEDLGRLLLLRHQKGRSEEKDSGMPAMHQAMHKHGYMAPGPHSILSLQCEDVSGINWPSGRNSVEDQRPDLKLSTSTEIYKPTTPKLLVSINLQED
ncbi:hypothetical protein CDAR_100871 [Caerostris darwini]|uniref:Uncharacterized protein n=1 Tax=Caerostris darwini TaxID=1538125 RepID=A0AAV4VUC1_9ARAC|nr:hypothetical protein CDAR_100871 [Caerostris darwini]